MIEFVECEPYTTATLPTRQKIIPTWMIKDGLEYFVAGLPIEGGTHGADYHHAEMERYKVQLQHNGGRYFKFHGQHDNPEEMIAETEKCGHTFTEKNLKNIFYESTDGLFGAGLVDFWGNRNEVSAAFYYRIFDREYAAELKERVNNYIEWRTWREKQ